MSRIEDIMARAMGASKAWPAVFRAGSAGELASAAIAGLEAAGFVIVPKEATDDMTIAGGEAQSTSIGSWGEPGVAYRAMIGARPK